MNFLGIYREPEFSPGRHTSNDAQILRLVGQALERMGVRVQLASLEEARSLWRTADTIFSMCQGPAALAELMEWKKQGASIYNSPAASLSTYRETLCRTLSQHALPFPRSVVLSTETPGDLIHFLGFFQPVGAWLKRADVHATRPEDVTRIPNLQSLTQALDSFRARGHKSAILQEHIEGDEVKFYAVRGERAPQDGRSPTVVCRGFFWPFYPKDCVGYPFDENRLIKAADDAARLLDLNVYGGDAIISPDGAITLIDVNDWPSFAPCRGAAAHAIADFLKESYVAQNRRPSNVAANV